MWGQLYNFFYEKYGGQLYNIYIIYFKLYSKLNHVKVQKKIENRWGVNWPIRVDNKFTKLSIIYKWVCKFWSRSNDFDMFIRLNLVRSIFIESPPFSYLIILTNVIFSRESNANCNQNASLAENKTYINIIVEKGKSDCYCWRGQQNNYLIINIFDNLIRWSLSKKTHLIKVKWSLVERLLYY